MGEDRYLFVVDYLDRKGYRKIMAIYDADNEEDCEKIFHENEYKANIKNIRRMSEYDYKHKM